MNQRTALKLVTGGVQSDAPVEWRWFCGHCAAPAPNGAAPPPTARVCTSCGLGLLLEAREDVVPDSRDAFLVVDSRLLIQAMSGLAAAGGRDGDPPTPAGTAIVAASTALTLAKWRLRGESIAAHLTLPPRLWALGVVGLFGYHALYFTALALAPPVEANLPQASP